MILEANLKFLLDARLLPFVSCLFTALMHIFQMVRQLLVAVIAVMVVARWAAAEPCYSCGHSGKQHRRFGVPGGLSQAGVSTLSFPKYSLSFKTQGFVKDMVEFYVDLKMLFSNMRG